VPCQRRWPQQSRSRLIDSLANALVTQTHPTTARELHLRPKGGRFTGTCAISSFVNSSWSADPEVFGLLSWAEAEVVEQRSGFVEVRG